MLTLQISNYKLYLELNKKDSYRQRNVHQFLQSA